MSEAATAGSSATPGAPNVWLYGRGIDLLLGYGLAYLLAVPVLLALGAWLGPESGLLWVSGAVALATTTPHYGATILRVYDGREERKRYALFAVWITAGLLCLFVAALYDRFVGSLLLTAYISWSPWHFSGQNYGLAAMYLRRNGVDFSPDVKRPLYLSFVLSAVLAFLVLHISDSGLSFAQDASDPSQTFAMLQLGIPKSVGSVLALLLFVAYVVCLGVLVLRLRPQLSARQLAPVGMLVATQALWFTVPALFTALAERDIQGLLPFTAIALSAAHSSQYLWVSCFYARRDRAAREPAPFLGRSLLAGSAISLPAILLAPGLMGGLVPNGGGILVLAFSIVNLHHFVLDGAIWKLRDGPVARALLRSEAASSDGALPTDASGRSWLRPLLAVLGVTMVLVKLQIIALVGLTTPEAETELLQTTGKQLAFYGRDTAATWMVLGARLESEGQLAPAVDAYRRSVKMGAPEPWLANRLAWLLINREPPDPQSLAEATDLARYLSKRLGSTRAEGLQTLAAAHAAAGRYPLAVRVATAAIAIARRNGEEERVRNIETQISSYRARANGGSGAPSINPSVEVKTP